MKKLKALMDEKKKKSEERRSGGGFHPFSLSVSILLVSTHLNNQHLTIVKNE